MEKKLQALCDKITSETQGRLKEDDLGCQCNLDNAIAHYHIAKKYTRVDQGSGGKYMVVNSTGEIFGIKAYGVIHKGHPYGTLDTTDDYFWGNYIAYKKD